jgi:hypothetical protein
MTWPANTPADVDRQWLFLIEMAAGTEPLLRALGVFPAQGARVAGLVLSSHAEAARLEVTATGLDALRAERLRARLAAVSTVQSVGVGWR